MESEKLRDLNATVESILNNPNIPYDEKRDEILNLCDLDDLAKINSDVKVDGLGPKKGKK